jgi:hypothetical protein
MIGQDAIQGLDTERKAGIYRLWAGGGLADTDPVLPKRGCRKAFEEVCGECHQLLNIITAAAWDARKLSTDPGHKMSHLESYLPSNSRAWKDAESENFPRPLLHRPAQAASSLRNDMNRT